MLTDGNVLRLDDPMPFHDEIRIVSPNIAVGTWMIEWSSKDVIQPFIDDLRRYFPIKISDNDVYNNKISLWEPSHFRRFKLPKELAVSFFACRGKRPR